jgi:hypothetical protein
MTAQRSLVVNVNSPRRFDIGTIEPSTHLQCVSSPNKSMYAALVRPFIYSRLDLPSYQYSSYRLAVYPYSPSLVTIPFRLLPHNALGYVFLTTPSARQSSVSMPRILSMRNSSPFGIAHSAYLRTSCSQSQPSCSVATSSKAPTLALIRNDSCRRQELLVLGLARIRNSEFSFCYLFLRCAEIVLEQGEG